LKLPYNPLILLSGGMIQEAKLIARLRETLSNDDARFRHRFIEPSSERLLLA
jgi:hypothetical protein